MNSRFRIITITLTGAVLLACGVFSTPTAVPAPSQTSPQLTQSVSPSETAASSQVMPPGDYKQKITSGGLVRPYILHVPPGYDGSEALPLVLVLHGFGGAAGGMVRLTGMSQKADQENFFVAYLNGTEITDPASGVSGLAWNSGLIPKLDMKVDDVAFVRDLVKELEAQLNVDSQRIYAAGFSNGAFMTHRLGADLPNLLAGIAAVEGTIGIGQSDGSFAMVPNPVGPIPVIIIHGKEDMNVLYDGGQATKGVGRINAKSVADAVAFWIAADGCTGTPLQETSPDGKVIREDYQACAVGSEVLLYTIVNGGHEWPTLQGHTNFSATDAIWDFFSQHHQ